MKRNIVATGSVLIMIACCLCVLLQACDSNKAKEIKPAEERPQQQKSFSDTYFQEIIPLVDGGAYAISGRSLWYLRGAEAIRVKEVPQMSSQPTSQLRIKREKVFWAFLQHERKKRKVADSQVENAEVYDDDYPATEEHF